MIRILSSEWLRTKRTAIRWLTLCLPVIFSLCVIAYLAVRSETSLEFVFEGFFTIWTVFMLPLGVGILAGATVQEEELAGSFHSFLGTGISRTKLYFGKYLFIVFCLSVCTFLAIFVLCSGLKFVLPTEHTGWLFWKAAALVMLGALPILAIHLWVSFVWGMGASVGMSIAGILIAAILGLTGLGSNIWMFVPWTWPVKLGMLPGTNFLKADSELSMAELVAGVTHTALVGLIAIFVCLLLTLIGGAIWFNIWEGKESCD